MPHAATITTPCTELTGEVEWLWIDLQETAFQAEKREAEDYKVLRHIDYDNSDMIWLFTNASPTGTGAWIGQGPTRDAARPASFHSRKLTPAQSNYPTYQQETLAIVEAMKSFAHLLLHRHFTVVTNHESLTSAKKLLPHVYHTVLPGMGGMTEYPYTSYPSGVPKLYLRVV